jgi:carbon-monoxide dehydrogenase small subunit
MNVNIEMRINGTVHRLSVEPTETVADVLRSRLGMTGTNKDCCMGICGACTVMLDDRTVSSCLLLAVQADGSDITTVEGLESAEGLSPVQEAFLRYGAVQCGYCTPGFVITATALLKENPHPTREQIVDALRGNLCRCTGYKKIVEAVEAVANRGGAGEPNESAAAHA